MLWKTQIRGKTREPGKSELEDGLLMQLTTTGIPPDKPPPMKQPKASFAHSFPTACRNKDAFSVEGLRFSHEL